jgi:serine protease
MKKSLLLAAVLTAACASAHAATWIIGNATALPGQTVNISIAFAGDGATEAAEIDLTFDEVRLTLPVASGALPNANVTGQCARTSSKTVSGLIYAASGVLPATAQIVCTIPFTVRPTARSGRIPLAASAKQCAAVNGTQPCAITAGWIDVQGSPPAAFNAPEQLETDSLLILLQSQGPTAQQLVAYDYRGDPAHAPLEGLRQGVLRVRGPNGYPAAGDFLARLQRQPESIEAQAERYVTADFESREARNQARILLASDPAVASVEPVVVTPINEAQPAEKSIPAASPKGVSAGSQDFLGVLGFDGAWLRAGGWGLVGVIDNGLDPNHPELRSFSGADSVGGSKVAGGNYLPYFSRNVGGRGQPVTDVDEIQPSVQQSINEEPCDVADGVDDGLLNFAFAGHGTHVAGLIAANSVDGGLRGGCSRCGLVMVKRMALYCDFSVFAVYPSAYPNIDGEAVEHLYKIGAQVVNMSYSNDLSNCQTASNSRVCNAIATAYRNDILMVAAAGNKREQLKFPALDPRVVSVGGLGASNDFWDESPGNNLSCPYADGRECGSNFAPSAIFGTSRQEVAAPATAVRSTMYPGRNWNTTIGCGDAFGDGASNDGEGTCTGTSMSAPEVAALFGLLRSVNPLMRVGDPVDQTTPVTPDGIREVLTSTSSRGATGQPESAQLGFGTPNATAAVAKILGTVRGMPVRNRVTPLFGMYSPGGGDYATVATPQIAMALHLYATNAYRSVHQAGDTFLQGAPVPGYPAFPNPDPDAGVPRARALILTTEFKPTILNGAQPTPVPLVLLERKRPGPVACDLSSPLCHGDIVVALESQAQAAVNAGYAYGGLQGYLYPTCSPSPACIPPGTQALHVKCNTAQQDCAAFLESDRLSFEAAGYAANFLSAPSSILGYAYPVADTDVDGLADGFEYAVGTSPTDADSDDDGLSDAMEYPMTRVPASDPCAGPNLTCLLGQHFIFGNGFE